MKKCISREEHSNHFYDSIANAARRIYDSNGNQPLKVLEVASGPGGFKTDAVKIFKSENIDYELVLIDINPALFKKGYELFERRVPEELKNTKWVLADATDLRKELQEFTWYSSNPRVSEKGVLLPNQEKIVKSVDDLLKDPEYEFLSTGHPNGKRAVDFSDKSFDIILGDGAYTNIIDYLDATEESARVLRKGGYHIISDGQVEKIKSYKLRADYTLQNIINNPKETLAFIFGAIGGIYRANSKNGDKIRSKLDSLIKPVAYYFWKCSSNTPERFPWQAEQHGDFIKQMVLVHQKQA